MHIDFRGFFQKGVSETGEEILLTVQTEYI